MKSFRASFVSPFFISSSLSEGHRLAYMEIKKNPQKLSYYYLEVKDWPFLKFVVEYILAEMAFFFW